MLYLITCVLGLLAGIAAKGSVRNLASFRFEKVWLILAAFLIQLAARLLSLAGLTAVKDSSILVYGIVFLFLAAVIWYNRSYIGVIIIGAGYFMNTLVMMLNGGKMPVSLEILNKYGLTQMVDQLKNEIDGKHTLLNESSKLPWLADIIHPPAFLSIFMEVVSPGDLVIVLGFAILMFEIIKGKKKKTEDVKCLKY